MGSPHVCREYTVREAAVDEREIVYNIVKEAFSSYKKNKDNPDLMETPSEVLSDIRENIVLVMEKNNKIIGTVRLIKKDEESYYLKKFAILPEYQGRGLGTILFTEAEKRAAEKNCNKIFLHSSTEEEHLVKFYDRLGFECIEVEDDMGYKRGLWVKKID